MKLNRKVFAGALALAMGLSAVAPSFAEKTVTTESDTALVLPTGKVDYTWLKELETKANEVVDLYNKMLEARRDEEAKQKAYDKAVAELEKAKKAYEDAKKAYEDLLAKQEELTNARNASFANYIANGGQHELSAIDKDSKITDTDDEEKNAAQAEDLKDIVAYKSQLESVEEELEGIEETFTEELDLVDRRRGDVNEAKNNLDKATDEREAAETAYNTEVEEFAKDAWVRNTINEAFRRGDVTILQRIVTELKKEPVINEEVVNTIVKDVLNDDMTSETPETGDKTVEEKIAELKAAVRKNEIQAAAAKLLMEKNPKAVAPFKADLEKLLATSEALVKKANDAIEKLEKKTSLLVTTAYASEDSEDLDSLINEINDNTQNISDKLDAVEKDAEKEEENKPADDQKPADDNKEEDKKDDNKAPVAKPAGNNAKTGVAGVAGVGAVLAAATAAYVGSKRK